MEVHTGVHASLIFSLSYDLTPKPVLVYNSKLNPSDYDNATVLYQMIAPRIWFYINSNPAVNNIVQSNFNYRLLNIKKMEIL